MIRNWLRNFMIGRYGPDQLNIALLITSIVIGLVGAIINISVLTIIGDVILSIFWHVGC